MKARVVTIFEVTFPTQDKHSGHLIGDVSIKYLHVCINDTDLTYITLLAKIHELNGPVLLIIITFHLLIIWQGQLKKLHGTDISIGTESFTVSKL